MKSINEGWTDEGYRVLDKGDPYEYALAMLIADHPWIFDNFTPWKIAFLHICDIMNDQGRIVENILLWKLEYDYFLSWKHNLIMSAVNKAKWICSDN